MDNTEKLYRAFLKCQGYEIEEVEVPLTRNTFTVDYIVTKKQQFDKISTSAMVDIQKLRFRTSRHNEWTDHDFGKSIL